MVNEERSQNTCIVHVSAMGEAEAYLADHRIDIIILDLGLADAQGLEAVERAHAAAPRVPLVVLTGMDDERLAAQALQQGAQDYLIKGQIETRGLARALRYAVERKAMEEALFAQTERAQVTLNCIADAVACADSDGNITFLNRVAESMTGWTLAEAAGRSMAEVIAIRDASSKQVVRNPMERAIALDHADRLRPNCVLLRRDGVETPIEDSVAPIHDREGQPIGAVIVFRDVSAARAMALHMAHSARHDFLTDLPNRMLLNDRLTQAIAAAPRHHKKVGVLFLDLDGFKHINDSLGHPVGDELLKSIARRLVTSVRGADTVSRQGGDEFVVLLSEIERPEDAALLAARMLQAVAEPYGIDGHDLHVTASIGVSIFPEDGADAETLIKHADTAMYQAKENGRQGYRFFEPAMNARAVERQSVEAGLRRALERQEFQLVYQPKIDLATGEIAGAEALIRWLHPVRGELLPSEFIPVAEASGLIRPIGSWVLVEACRQAREWSRSGLKLPQIAVNISALEFRSENFLKGISDVLDEIEIAPTVLELELTESALMRHAESTDSILRMLRDRGVRLAVDDFGTGYSSLSYLRKFPIDTLKIDRSFVRQIGALGKDATIVDGRARHGQEPGAAHRRRGRGDARRTDLPAGAPLRRGPGLLFQPAVPPARFAELLDVGIVSTMAAQRLATQPPDHIADRRPAATSLAAG